MVFSDKLDGLDTSLKQFPSVVKLAGQLHLELHASSLIHPPADAFKAFQAFKAINRALTALQRHFEQFNTDASTAFRSQLSQVYARAQMRTHILRFS